MVVMTQVSEWLLNNAYFVVSCECIARISLVFHSMAAVAIFLPNTEVKL
jgi:hypothetical protein